MQSHTSALTMHDFGVSEERSREFKKFRISADDATKIPYPLYEWRKLY